MKTIINHKGHNESTKHTNVLRSCEPCVKLCELSGKKLLILNY